MDVAGGAAFRSGTTIERCYRDTRGAKLHPLTPELTLLHAGRLALGQPADTSVSVGPAGVLVSELTGFPFPVGGADVYAFDPTAGTIAPIESDFSAIVDIAQGADGSIYVLEFAAEGLLEAESGDAPPVSRLTKIGPDGTRTVLLQSELIVPNGVAVGPDGMVYVSNGSQLAAGGSVIRIDPAAA